MSRSGFYKWQKHVPSQREESTKALESMIKEIYKEHKGRIGCPKMLLELKERGIHAGKNRVAALMRANGLRAITHRKFRPSTTDSNHELPIAENLLNRDFTATAPNTEVLLWIHKYGTPEEGGYSEKFAVVTANSAFPAPKPQKFTTALHGSPMFYNTGNGHRFNYSIARNEVAYLHIVRLDGSLVARIPLSAKPGEHIAVWDGRDTNGRAIGQGIFVGNVVSQK